MKIKTKEYLDIKGKETILATNRIESVGFIVHLSHRHDAIHLSKQQAIAFANEILEMVDAKPMLSQSTINGINTLIRLGLANTMMVPSVEPLKKAQEEFTKVFGEFKELEKK